MLNMMRTPLYLLMTVVALAFLPLVLFLYLLGCMSTISLFFASAALVSILAGLCSMENTILTSLCLSRNRILTQLQKDLFSMRKAILSTFLCPGSIVGSLPFTDFFSMDRSVLLSILPTLLFVCSTILSLILSLLFPSWFPSLFFVPTAMLSAALPARRAETAFAIFVEGPILSSIRVLFLALFAVLVGNIRLIDVLRYTVIHGKVYSFSSRQGVLEHRSG